MQDDRKCENKTDRKMVKALNNVSSEERHWGHRLALIDKKQKLGLGVSKNWKSSRVKKNWQEKLADELHKPIKRDFTRRRVTVNLVEKIVFL